MKRRRSALAAGLAALFVLVSTLVGVQGAGAQPSGAQDPVRQESGLLRLEVTSMNPRIVSHDSDELTIKAEVTNVSRAPIANVRARLQLGAAQTTSGGLREALSARAPTDSQLTPFIQLAESIAPGRTAQLTLTADLRGGIGGLLFTKPGVYPLLININGHPDQAAEARLTETHLLLPVLGTPGGQKPTAPDTPKATSLLWPIASKPRVVSAPYDGTVVLSDETLAKELRPGGRLDSLVRSAARVTREDRLHGAMCFAVDPELVTTVKAMTGGYRVKDGSKTKKGTGRQEAASWLKSLKELVADRCVLTMPYAGADVSALAESSTELAKSAAARDDILREELAVRPLPSVSWPATAVTREGVGAFAAAGKTDLVTSSGKLDPSKRVTTPVGLSSGDDDSGKDQRALPYDDLTALSLASGTASSDTGPDVAVAADEPAIATQNAVSTLAFHAAGPADTQPGTLLIAPPQHWDVPARELDWLLDNIDRFASGDMIALESFEQLLRKPASGAVEPPSGTALTSRLPAEVAEDIKRVGAKVSDLVDAMDVSPVTRIEPEDLLSPVREGLIRTASTWWQDNTAAVKQALSNGKAQLSAITDGVRVTDPGRTISLGSESAPIPVSIKNTLPVDITVQVTLADTTGLRPGRIRDPKIAANSTLNFQVPAEALRAGRFSVDVELNTPGGTDLGRPTRFELASTEYGLITVIVTATAAGALLLLSGRRIYRRLRANGEGEH